MAEATNSKRPYIHQADLSGGTNKGVTSVVRLYDNKQGRTDTNGKPYGFVQAEMARFDDTVNPKQPTQRTTKYFNQQSVDAKGEPVLNPKTEKPYYNSEQFYSQTQIDELVTAAGDNVQPITHNGKEIGKVLVVDVDLAFTKDGTVTRNGQTYENKARGLLMKTSTAKPFEGKVPENLHSAQIEGSKADHAKFTAEAAVQKAAAEAEAQNPEASAPSVEPAEVTAEPEF